MGRETSLAESSVVKPGYEDEVVHGQNGHPQMLPYLAQTQDFLSLYHHLDPRHHTRIINTLLAPIVLDYLNLARVITYIDLLTDAQNRSNPNAQEKILAVQKAAEVKSQIIGHIENLVANTALDKCTPEFIEQLIKLRINSKGTLKQAVDAIIKGVFRIPEHMGQDRLLHIPMRTIKLYYNCALAMAKTQNQAVAQELLDILCLESEAIGKKTIAPLAFAWGASFIDPEILIKYEFVNSTIEYVGCLLHPDINNLIFTEYPPLESLPERLTGFLKQLPTESKRKYHQLVTVLENNSVWVRIPQKSKPDTKLAQANLPRSKSDRGLLYYARESTEGHNDPHNPLSYEIRQSCLPQELFDTLNQLIYPKLAPLVIDSLREGFSNIGFPQITETGVQITPDFQLNIFTNQQLSPERKKRLVIEVYESLLNGTPFNPSRNIAFNLDQGLLVMPNKLGSYMFFDQEETIIITLIRNADKKIGRLGSLLPHIRSEIPDENLDKLRKDIDNIRQEIRQSNVRRVGERGYYAVITDPEIRDLGYQSLTVHQRLEKDSNAYIHVKLRINKRNYHFSLSSDYQLMFEKDLQGFVTDKDRYWLELLILSHLKPIVCPSEDSFENGLYNPRRQGEGFRKQVRGRDEHLVELNPQFHRSFSPEAADRYIQSKFAQDSNYAPTLDQLNKNRGRLRVSVDRFFTYHQADQIDTLTQRGPIKIALSIQATNVMREILPEISVRSEQYWNDLEEQIFGELDDQ